MTGGKTAVAALLLALPAILLIGRAGRDAARAPADLRDAVGDTSALDGLKSAGPGTDADIPMPKSAGMVREKSGGAGVSPPLPQTAKAPARKPAELTFLVYMNGKNDLARLADRDLAEMQNAVPSHKVHIVAEVGRFRQGVKRYYIGSADAFGEPSAPRLIADLGPADMGDWRSLAAFGSWARENYPAKRYILVVWNHGSGWTKSGAAFRGEKGISYDHETGGHFSTPELAAALKEMGGVDILAMDACLMQMAEVAWELRNYAEVIAASEEIMQGDGFPYDRILSRISKNPAASNEALAGIMVEQFNGYYREAGKVSTLSALRTGALPGFLSLVNAWADAALREDPAKLAAAVRASKTYDIPENKDLRDFLGRLASYLYGSGEFLEKGASLKTYIENDLIIANAATGREGPDPGSGGIAIFLPLREGYSGGYDELAWARDSRWDEFLKYMRGPSFP